MGKRHEQIARQLLIREEILSVHGIEIIKHAGAWVMRIPYRDINGVVRGKRIFAADPNNPSEYLPTQWESKEAKLPFGIWQIGQWRDEKFIFICSDVIEKLQCDTMGIPALAIEDGDDFEAISELDQYNLPPLIFPKKWTKFGKPHPSEAARKHLPNTKCYWAPNSNRHLLKAWLKGETKKPSLLYSEFFLDEHFQYQGSGTVTNTIDDYRQACKSLTQLQDISTEFAKALPRLGYGGSTDNAWLLYLIFTSRLFDKPLSVVISGPSSVGKSFLVDRVREFMPTDSYEDISTATKTNLLYSGESLIKKMLLIQELAGVDSKDLDFIFRVMLSEQKTVHGTTKAAKGGGREPVNIEARFQVGLIITTTKLKIDEENRTRMLEIRLSGDPKTTLAALPIKREKGFALAEEWEALQKYLELQPCEVNIPYEQLLLTNLSPYSSRILRDKSAVIGIIKAHALIHREQRQTTGNEIEATLFDYEVCHRLLNPILSELSMESVPEKQRTIVEAVESLLRKDKTKKWVSQQEIANSLGLKPHNVTRDIKPCFENGWLVLNGRGVRGTKQISLGEPMPTDSSVLPDPKLIKQLFNMKVSTSPKSKARKLKTGAASKPKKKKMMASETFSRLMCYMS